jgi:ABC-type molybdate transport system substrate-binding protein
LVGSQRVATAKSGVQMSGSSLVALRDTFFNTEMDAIGIRYAGSIEEAAKINEAAMARASASAQSATIQNSSLQNCITIR